MRPRSRVQEREPLATRVVLAFDPRMQTPSTQARVAAARYEDARGDAERNGFEYCSTERTAAIDPRWGSTTEERRPMAQSSNPEADAALADLGDLIQTAQADAVRSTSVAYGDLTVTAIADRVVELIKFLRDHPSCQFTTLVDLCGVDHPEREKRFEVVYHLLSMPLNQRLRVKASVREDEVVPSLVGVYPSANWFEREAFDMYGVIFAGHPDLRRILTDYGFRGYPLRKDFPTTGYVEVRYDEAAKRVVYEPVKLVQDYRLFDFMSPWEGAEYILPGDEKTTG